jgi:hypothetical protein
MWDLNYITWFKFEASNSGLDLSTWFGDFQIPARTFVLITLGVIVLRVRKNLIAKNKKRKTVKK